MPLNILTYERTLRPCSQNYYYAFQNEIDQSFTFITHPTDEYLDAVTMAHSGPRHGDDTVPAAKRQTARFAQWMNHVTHDAHGTVQRITAYQELLFIR